MMVRQAHHVLEFTQKFGQKSPLPLWERVRERVEITVKLIESFLTPSPLPPPIKGGGIQVGTFQKVLGKLQHVLLIALLCLSVGCATTGKEPARPPQTAEEIPSLYKQAVSYFKQGNFKKTLTILDRIPWYEVDTRVGVRAGSLRVITARKLQDKLEEEKGYLELLDAYEVLDPNESKVGDLNWIVSQKTARNEVRQWVNAEPNKWDNLSHLKSWIKRFEGKNSGSYLTWKLARLFYQKGDYKKAAEFSRHYLSIYPKQEYAASARQLSAEIDKRGELPKEATSVPIDGGRPTIGVLLPLTGKYAVYGESVLHGLECAAGIFTPCHDDLGVNLVVRDTKGDPEQIHNLIDEFSDNSEIRVLIGPLAQTEMDSATAAAEQHGLSMIVLSQKKDVAKAGEFIFRNFLTIEDQVATLVDYVCGDLKLKRLALLCPAGVLGEEYHRIFEEQVSQCGGKVVAQASYPENTKDFTDALRELNASRREQSSGSSVPYQVLFIPDVYRKIPSVVQALKFLNVTGVRLMGGAGWDHPGLMNANSDYLEGAIFVDGFFPKGSSYATRDFVSTFQTAYGVEPTLLEAYAYDTLRLVGEVLKDHPSSDRSEIQKVLAQKRNFSGVTGTISFDEEGDARRRLSILTIEKGEIREVK